MQWVVENPQYLKFLKLDGYLVGSPNTDDFIDQNSKVEFAHRTALISDITYNVISNFNYDTWENDEAVQDALHIHKGTVNKWSRCNLTMSYTIDQPSVVQVHQNLTNYNLRLLVY
ncbi:Serine carboxypeptidase-like 17, partial [Bienertia sinuspersici]